jgi:2-amino-4-hydroxy-6-hydroxymethyldihydropteridine diphosphokinase
VDHVRRVVIGLGSNLGDRSQSLRDAIDLIRQESELVVLKESPIYETEPLGGPPQGDYLNAAVLLVTSLSGQEILTRILSIEEKLGRHRAPGDRNAPRVIDLDILWIEGEVIREESLVVPHPRLTARAFALRPMLDVAPDASDLSTGQRFADLPAASIPLKKA